MTSIWMRMFVAAINLELKPELFRLSAAARTLGWDLCGSFGERFK